MKPEKRLIASIAVCFIGVVYLAESVDTAFTITETSLPDIAPGAVLHEPPPAIDPPAEIVCTFRCAHCRRAPTLTYHEGDQLPIYANCIECGERMPRTDPKLSAEEAQRLNPPTAQQSRRVYQANCST